jgi:hypothetical protein
LLGCARCSKSPEGEIYYFNFNTGESVWDHPCDEYYKCVLVSTLPSFCESSLYCSERGDDCSSETHPFAAGTLPASDSCVSASPRNTRLTARVTELTRRRKLYAEEKNKWEKRSVERDTERKRRPATGGGSGGMGGGGGGGMKPTASIGGGVGFKGLQPLGSSLGSISSSREPGRGGMDDGGARGGGRARPEEEPKSAAALMAAAAMKRAIPKSKSGALPASPHSRPGSSRKGGLCTALNARESERVELSVTAAGDIPTHGWALPCHTLRRVSAR